MDGTRIRLNLNLQNLSMISIAAKLWDSQDIKNQIKNNFSSLERRYPDENWCEISKRVVESTNSINLPASLSVLLKKTILLIGQNIYDWNFYVTQMLKLDLIFTQKIFFNLGVVDKIKIFDLYWRDLMARDNYIYQSDYFKHSPLFSLACIYGRERFIKERKNEMLDELNEFYPQMKTGDEIYNIMSVSLCMTSRRSIPENVASPHRMFELCLHEGFSKAARFYWEKLDEVEKVSNLIHFAKKCFVHYYDDFLIEPGCENLLFLINQMGEEERSLFFTDYADKIIRVFLPIWPYQELTVNLLKYDWILEWSRLLHMAEFLISFSERMNRLEFPLDSELIFLIMQKVWGYFDVDEKFCILMEHQKWIPRLFSALNSKILNLFFNDPGIIDTFDRKGLHSSIKDGFLKLIKLGKFDFLNSIIETIFNFVPEPKKFSKEYFSNHLFVLKLINNDESLGFLDQFLDWSAGSEAERARLKSKINTISICRCLTESLDSITRSFNFELANKFLKWRLESAAEIKTFKDRMKSSNFVIVEKSEYVRIKSGDLSWLRRGDLLATHPDEDLYDNADGFKFLKFGEVTELNRGVVLDIKSFCSGLNDDFFGPDGCRAKRWCVDYVGSKAGDYIVFTVHEIWKYNRFPFDLYGDPICLSDAFIKFYYETEEAVLKVKKTKLHVLVTENPIEFLYEVFQGRGDVRGTVLDDFCEYCMIPSEEIEEIKIQQQSDVENVLDKYLIDQRRFYLVDCYLNWLFGDVKKTEVCKKFLNSSNKGALLSVSYLKELRGSRPLNYEKLEICRWLCLVFDMEKLKNDLFALYENTPEWFPALLDEAAHCDVNAII